MKKFLVTLLMLVMALALVACGGESNKGLDATGAKKIYDDTMEEYSKAKGVDAEVSYTDGVTQSKISFAYNIENDKIKELAYVVYNEQGELSIYVKDNKAYMNAYGTKTVADMSDEDYANFAEKYTFAAAVKEINMLFGYTFFNASELKESTAEKVKLSCDLTKLEADPALDEDAFFEMEENIEKLQAKKALDVEFNYADGKMTKFVGTVTEQDDSTKTFTVEFKGISANITFPDLTGYAKAE